MHVPRDGWINGSWKRKWPQFRSLGEMVGLGPAPSSDELQTALKQVASAKVFAESVEAFLAATGKERSDVMDELEKINNQLGTMEPVPFRSLVRGEVDPASFHGTAIWPAGTVAWTEMRWEQIRLAEKAGATFERIIVLGSSRVCNSAADRRHPYIREIPEGQEPTERELMRQWVRATGHLSSQYVFPELPETNEQGRPMSLEQQLNHLIMQNGEDAVMLTMGQLYVPANPNALYVPLHVRRVLKRQDIWFSQGGARIQREMPSWWWPQVQDLATTPSGILRLWIELEAAGCFGDPSKHTSVAASRRGD